MIENKRCVDKLDLVIHKEELLQVDILVTVYILAFELSAHNHMKHYNHSNFPSFCMHSHLKCWQKTEVFTAWKYKGFGIVAVVSNWFDDWPQATMSAETY